VTPRAGRAHGRAAALAFAALAALQSGCTRERIAYRPQASLGTRAEPLPLRVELRALEDASPAEDRMPGFRGTALTASEYLSEALEAAVTRALLEGWRSDAVFEALDPAPAQDAQLVLHGAIRRFYGKSAPSGLGWFSWLVYLDSSGILSNLILFGAPTHSVEGQVSLELRVARTNGEPVASYSAISSFSEAISIHGDAVGTLGPRLNRVFGAVLTEIRTQLLADRTRLLAAAAP
jgi:hypothetical protein